MIILFYIFKVKFLRIEKKMSKRTYPCDDECAQKKIRISAVIALDIDSKTEWYTAEQMRKIVNHLKRQYEQLLDEKELELQEKLQQQFKELTRRTRDTPSYIS